MKLIIELYQVEFIIKALLFFQFYKLLKINFNHKNI